VNLRLSAKMPATLIALTAMAGALLLTGCFATQRPSSTDELAAFRAAGPLRPAVDLDVLVKARMPGSAYRVIPGDVMDLNMPMVMWAATADTGEKVELYRTRVSSRGRINLPLVGDMAVSGKTLSEIESAVAAVYHPKYLVDSPSVVATIVDYSSETVSVIGAVERPGVYPLHSDELSLVSALMKAGGIAKDGAGVIRIRRASAGAESEPLLIPVKGMNVPFADVVVRAGDTIEVNRLDPQFFTVMGLVRSPGAFPYPPGAKFNLIQAVAFAGGLNELAAPRYVTVYRQAADGHIVPATFNLQGNSQTDAATVDIRPGDVVAVEQDGRTSARLLIAEVLLLNVGLDFAGLYKVGNFHN
jgi:polysaccharide biosynthesis/export protein